MRAYIFAAICLLSIPASDVRAGQGRPLKVVASFTILADMAANVGGDRIEVKSLVGPNGDPHAFEPTPTDARWLKDADLVIVNGLGLEGWMDRLILASGYKGRPVRVSDGVEPLTMDEDGRTVVDPHAWNSAANGILYIKAIAAALTAADPADAAFFQTNAKDYAAKLAVLDADMKKRIADLPANRRKVLTTHDALGYFAKAYGVEILSPLGISTEQEPSASAMANLIGQLKREHIRTYFLENSNDPRLIQQIARAAGATPGGDLFVEALSPRDGAAPTYLAMLRHNFDLIIRSMHNQS